MEISAHISQSFLSIRQSPISQHPRLWVTSNPNIQDHINSSRNGTNDPTHETQTLNTRHFRQHDNNQNRLLLLTAEHFPLDWVDTLKHGTNHRALLPKLLMTNHQPFDNVEASPTHQMQCLSHLLSFLMQMRRLFEHKFVMTRLMSTYHNNEKNPQTHSDRYTLHHWGLATSLNKHATGLPQPTNAKKQTKTHTQKQQKHKAKRQQV
ncbi:unnamed protein product [Penicillium palitans]